MKRDKPGDARDGGMSRRDVFRAAAVVAAAPLLQSAGNAQPRTPVPEDGGTLETSWRQPPTNRSPSFSEAEPS